MTTLLRAGAGMPGWHTATGTADGTELFDFPLLGHPAGHRCNELRSKTSSVSVLIPTWNSLPSLRVCLAALERSSLNRLAQNRLQVVICDDGSNDGTWDDLRDRPAALDLLVLRLDHQGQSSALNAGLAAARGHIVVICDSDMILGCGALDELVSRHERWPAAACFGFRTDVDALPASANALIEMMHTEALTGDNRVRFHRPSLMTNMLVDSKWLAALADGRHLLDCEGSQWRRHRFLYGCLFSAPRALFEAVGGMPDGVPRWGYQDTLVAAAFEAHGSFLLPVVAATAHHVAHPIRHSDQWFQYHRNRLAYEFILGTDAARHWWRRPGAGSRVLNSHAARKPPELIEARMVADSGRLDYFLGRWERLLERSDDSDPAEIAECLYRTGRHDELVERADDSYWRAAALALAGRSTQARACLERAAEHDEVARYVQTASTAELLRLAHHYHEQGLAEIAGRYEVAARLAGE